ncbi:MAG: hypothetical protein ACI4UW_06145 [Muribaculaceae bacterium]
MPFPYDAAALCRPCPLVQDRVRLFVSLWHCINHLEIVPDGNSNVLCKTVYIDNIVINN